MAKVQAVSEQCPVEAGLNILSGKWNLKLLWLLSGGPQRFNELQRRLEGIPTKTLARQLRELEAQGIVAREVFPDAPPRVEYSLSALGESLSPVLAQLCDWGKHYYAVRMGSKSL